MVWAELLNLEDPREKGARKIKNALKKLENLGFIRLERLKGKASTIHLLSELGDGSPYERPADTYYKKSKTSSTYQDLYFQISGALLREGIFQELSGPGLVMLIILCAEEAYKKPVWFSTKEFPKRYAISSATRAKGTQELIKIGVLRASATYIDEYGRTTSLKTKRIRKRYRLVGDAKLVAIGEK